MILTLTIDEIKDNNFFFQVKLIAIPFSSSPTVLLIQYAALVLILFLNLKVISYYFLLILMYLFALI